MIFWELFCVFLKIGTVSFGGGYGMISLIREEVISRGWMSEDMFLNMIAVSESTPGPLAVNIATFVGASRGGFWGACVATFGVVLPSFIIILLIAVILNNLMKYRSVNAVLSGIRPAVIGLILSTGALLFLSVFLSVSHVGDRVSVDIPAIFIFLFLTLFYYLRKKRFHKNTSPIVMILISAVLGILLYSVNNYT